MITAKYQTLPTPHYTLSLTQDDRGNPTCLRSPFQPSSASFNSPPELTINTKVEPPCSFQKPHQRFKDGMKQLTDQHNVQFQPPMPKPPLFAAW